MRCDRHVGEPYPPRCATCDGLEAEYKALQPAYRYLPNSDCAEHHGYPLPCDLCRRLRLQELDLDL